MPATINTYRGDSVPRAKVVNITPIAPVAVGQIFTLWCNGKGVSYTALAADGVAGVVAGLVAAVQSTTIPEFAEFTASQAGIVLVLTAATPGVPFDVAVTSSGNVTVAETTVGVGPTNEVHQIQLLGTYTAGNYTLTYNFGAGNVTTGNIAYNATAAAVQTAIAALVGAGAGNVQVTGGPGPSSPWFVSWIGALAGTAVTPGTVNGAGLTGSGSVNISTQQPGAAPTDCLQQIQLFASGGTFTLTFLGQTTGNITLGSSAATIQTALQGLSSVGAGNALVYGEGATGSNNANLFFVRFTNSLAATSLPVITVNTAGLTGSASSQIVQQGAAASQAAYQFVDLTNGVAVNSTFTLTFNGQTTGSISTMPGGPGYVSSAVKSALQAIGCPVVSVIGSDSLTGVASTTFAVKITSSAPAAAPVLTATIASYAPTITVLSNGLASQNCIQQVWVAASGGTFTLTLGAQTTAAIAYNAVAATVQTRLQTDLAATIIACTVTGTGTQASPWVITVTNPANTAVAQMTGNPAGLSGGGSITEVTRGQAGTNEVQTITEAAGTNGGTFTLGFMGPATPPLPYNATAPQVQAALRALSTINTVTVTGGAGGPFTVTWSGAQGSAQQPLLFADGSQLTGATANLITLVTATWSAGPNHYDDPTNWSLGHVPNTLEALVFDLGSSNCLYGLNQMAVVTASVSNNNVTWALGAGGSAGNGFAAGSFQSNQAVYFTNAGGALPTGITAGTLYYLVNVNRDAGTAQLATTLGGAPITISGAGTGTHTMGTRLASIEETERFGGAIGLPRRNSAGYQEYRPRYLHVGLATTGQGGLQTVTIGPDAGSGAGKTQIDNDVDQAVWLIIQTGGSIDSESRDVLLKGTNASNTLEMLAGDAAVSLFEGETSTLASIKLRGGTLELGPGLTITGPVTRTGGTLISDGCTLNGVLTL